MIDLATAARVPSGIFPQERETLPHCSIRSAAYSLAPMAVPTDALARRMIAAG
jgi:hypothetical protein